MPFVALSTAEKLEAHIRRRFKEWFDESGQTQKEAGEPIEWEQQTVSCYFRGEQQIDFMRAVAWCKHFGRRIDQLLSESPSPRPTDPKLQEWINIYQSQDKRRQAQLLALGPILLGERPKKAPKAKARTK